MIRLFSLCLLMFALVIAPFAASALPYTAPPDSFGSSATFEVVSGNLIITLTDGRDATQGGQELTALFFNLNGFSGTLTPVSALTDSSSHAGAGLVGTSNTAGPYPLIGYNVGGEWAYRAGLPSNPTGASFGISSSGLSPLSLFGAPNFNGPNLDDPAALDGGNWGLTNGTTVLSGNNTPLWNNAVQFILSGAGSFVPSDTSVTGVTYWYGTSMEATPVPEPSTLLFLGCGLISLGGFARWKTKK